MTAWAWGVIEQGGKRSVFVFPAGSRIVFLPMCSGCILQTSPRRHPVSSASQIAARTLSLAC